MLQETLNLLRRQYLGLNRVLSTVMRLISEGMNFSEENRLLEFAAGLLIDNHNFQYCTIHLIEDDRLKLACAVSTNRILGQAENEGLGDWVITCEHVAQQLIEQQNPELTVREDGDTVYYASQITYQGSVLGVLTINSPSFDDNHPKLVGIYCSILTSVLINNRQNLLLGIEVARRTEELESAWRAAEGSSEAKSRFLNNMSHEYLTPLNSIVGSGMLLSETRLDPEQETFVRTILNSAQSLKLLVGDTLDYSLTETGELPIHPHPTHLHESLQELHRIFLPQASAKNLELRLLIAPDVPKEVEVDERRLRQMLSNIIANAIKFTQRGRITVDVYCEASREESADIRFSVLDTGMGIEGVQQSGIFDAFHQVDGSATRKVGGAGLGLAITQKLAKLMGSSVELQSELESGSRFSFLLTLPAIPVSIREIVQAPIGNPDEPFQRRMSVLLVEDNVINQRLAARLLEKMGCVVDIAEDGVVAVRKFRSGHFDLVFMDCQMPNMDGFEATSQIRAMEDGARTPIVALTANCLPEDRARSYRAGMDEFLTKPIVKEKLAHALSRWVS